MIEIWHISFPSIRNLDIVQVDSHVKVNCETEWMTSTSLFVKVKNKTYLLSLNINLLEKPRRSRLNRGFDPRSMIFVC